MVEGVDRKLSWVKDMQQNLRALRAQGGTFCDLVKLSSERAPGTTHHLANTIPIVKHGGGSTTLSGYCTVKLSEVYNNWSDVNGFWAFRTEQMNEKINHKRKKNEDI